MVTLLTVLANIIMNYSSQARYQLSLQSTSRQCLAPTCTESVVHGTFVSSFDWTVISVREREHNVQSSRISLMQ